MLRPRKFRWLQRQSVRPIWPPPMSPLCRLCTRPWMWCRRTTNCQSWWCGSWRKLLSRGNCIARMDTTMRQSTIVLCLSLQDKRNLQSSSVFLRGISRFHAQEKVAHRILTWSLHEFHASILHVNKMKRDEKHDFHAEYFVCIYLILISLVMLTSIMYFKKVSRLKIIQNTKCDFEQD